MSKGSAVRPRSVEKQEFDSNWDRIFGKKDVVQEHITHVAIMVDGKVTSLPKPYRHHHCIQQVRLEQNKRVITESQGFLTNTGRYVDRVEAKEIAQKANQIIRPESGTIRLFSENLW